MNSFDNLYSKIERAVEDLTTLTIITAVGNVTISEERKLDGDEVKKTRTENYENAKAIITKIDLIDGDIETTIDTAFAAASDSSYAIIYKDHIARISEAHNIVEKNIETLKILIDTVRGILSNKPQPPAQPVPVVPPAP